MANVFLSITKEEHRKIPIYDEAYILRLYMIYGNGIMTTEFGINAAMTLMLLLRCYAVRAYANAVGT